MKRPSLVTFSLSLTKMQSTPAHPASVFQPILSDIRNQLPQGTEIR
ncbi:hypothetical protein SAMD00079811_18760 [Scytonema sp. HK-05]|nr:hypothetical protein [Scytonema sp. HK-05]BAY44280.1 hypothetical protein SAMD00079811_18760 [Scytonema sp. HK-05]